MKITKLIGLIIVLVVPYLAHASGENKVRAQERFRVALETVNLSRQDTRNASDRACKEQVQLKIKEVEAAIVNGFYGEKYVGGMDFACDEVTFRVVSERGKEFHFWTMDKFWLDADYRAVAQVEVFCHPRPFSQSVLVVYTRNCINDPTPDCLTDEKKQLMDSLPKTRYVYDYSKSCLADFQ